MNFSGISSRTFLGKLLRTPLKFVPGQAIVPVLQGELRGARWIVGSGVHGYWLGSYEYDKQKAFLAILQPGQVVFDIGAHVGFYTLLASRIVGPNGRVVAFEPSSINLHYLKRHIELNHCDNVDIRPIAISNRSGTANFSYQQKDSSMGCLADSGEIEVKVSSLDEEVSRIGWTPDVIKVDIEGEELKLLEGASNTLKTQHPKLFLATHSQDLHGECINFLRKLQYDARPIPSNSDLRLVREVLAIFRKE